MGNVLRGPNSNQRFPTPQVAKLTQAEINLIRATWKIPSSKRFDAAELIFFTFLERFPQNLKKFPAFKDIPLSNLKGQVAFRAHASKIFNVFDNIIDALDKDPDMVQISKYVATIGEVHRKKNITKKSQNDLRAVLMDVMSEICRLQVDGKAAWTKFFNIVFHIIFECVDGRGAQFK